MCSEKQLYLLFIVITFFIKYAIVLLRVFSVKNVQLFEKKDTIKKNNKDLGTKEVFYWKFLWESLFAQETCFNAINLNTSIELVKENWCFNIPKISLSSRSLVQRAVKMGIDGLNSRYLENGKLWLSAILQRYVQNLILRKEKKIIGQLFIIKVINSFKDLDEKCNYCYY